MASLTSTEHDITFMHLAIAEAAKADGKTSPNPCVGAVIVRNGVILARGYHEAAGLPHAEIEALRHLSSPIQARGATLYVTLEPCSTTGKTPPCTEAIIAAGFARVVYGATDPNPHHAGRAAQLLATGGIEVTTGVLEKKCAALNKYWNHRMKTGFPWVIAKCGMSLDGRLSSFPGRRWITSTASRNDAMRLRSNVEAILVGGATIREDNPALTVRGPSLKKITQQPWRVVWTESGNIPKDARILNDEHHARTLIFRGLPLDAVLQELGGRGISSVLIEGGGETLSQAFESKLIDEVRFYVAPQLLGGPIGICKERASIEKKTPTTQLQQFKKISYRKLGNDLLISGLVARSCYRQKKQDRRTSALSTRT